MGLYIFFWELVFFRFVYQFLKILLKYSGLKILHQFQVYHIVLQYFYTLQNGHHDKSSHPLPPSQVITVLLATPPILDISSVQSLSRVQLFATPWTAALQASLSITSSQSLLKLVHRVSDAIQPSHPLVPFPSCPQSLPASGSFPLSQLFTWGGQSIGVSASASILCITPPKWCTL